jgi:hypothetical protein
VLKEINQYSPTASLTGKCTALQCEGSSLS